MTRHVVAVRHGRNVVLGNECGLLLDAGGVEHHIVGDETQVENAARALGMRRGVDEYHELGSVGELVNAVRSELVVALDHGKVILAALALVLPKTYVTSRSRAYATHPPFPRSRRRLRRTRRHPPRCGPPDRTSPRLPNASFQSPTCRSSRCTRYRPVRKT